jgi:hypothetical protein
MAGELWATYSATRIVEGTTGDAKAIVSVEVKLITGDAKANSGDDTTTK